MSKTKDAIRDIMRRDFSPGDPVVTPVFKEGTVEKVGEWKVLVKLDDNKRICWYDKIDIKKKS